MSFGDSLALCFGRCNEFLRLFRLTFPASHLFCFDILELFGRARGLCEAPRIREPLGMLLPVKNVPFSPKNRMLVNNGEFRDIPGLTTDSIRSIPWFHLGASNNDLLFVFTQKASNSNRKKGTNEFQLVRFYQPFETSTFYAAVTDDGVKA